ncbi:hypothetical protein P9112_010155 [Eukaryota sp. TZLM1-RC]
MSKYFAPASGRHDMSSFLPERHFYHTSHSSSNSFSPQIPSSIPVSSSVDSNYPFSRTISLTSMENDSVQQDMLGDPNSDRPERSVGVKSICSSDGHTLLVTHSGEVYGWGKNHFGQVLYDGPESIKSPIKLPLNDIQDISAGSIHSLAISSDGKLYGWGGNKANQIIESSSNKLPITKTNIPYKIKEVYCDHRLSFALTQEGKIVKCGNSGCVELIEGLNNIVSMSVDRHSFVAVDLNGDFYHVFAQFFGLLKIRVPQHISTKEPSKGSFFLYDNYLFVIDVNGDVWKFFKDSDDVTFDDPPTKVPGLTNILFINGCKGVYAAIDNCGKVFVWGQLSRISDLYNDSDEPICFETLTYVERVSVGYNFLFAYNKNTVLAWGSNDKGQLGIFDLIDRPQPVKVFGSEILGSFRHPQQPLGRMFRGLIKLVYWEYLCYLPQLFGNHPYIKARFYTKCGISKRVAHFAQEVFRAHPIQNKIFLKDPRDLNLNENISDLQLKLSTDYQCSKEINAGIKQLDVYCEVDYDPQLFSFFPNVEVIKLKTMLMRPKRYSLHLAHLSNLKCLVLHYPYNMEQLPTSLVKLVLHDVYMLTDFSYLTSLKELVVLKSRGILDGQIPLPHSLIRVTMSCPSISCEMQLPNLEELVIHEKVPSNIIEQNFPSLRFIQMIESDKDSLSSSSLFPAVLINQGLIESVELIKNGYLVELSCFPWWIQYPGKSFLIDIFHEYVGQTEKAFH